MILILKIFTSFDIKNFGLFVCFVCDFGSVCVLIFFCVKTKIIIFQYVNELLHGLNKFLSDINKGNVIECLLPNGVLRIKNGLSDMKWKSYKDAENVDIKLKIIYIDKNRNSSMTTEGPSIFNIIFIVSK